MVNIHNHLAVNHMGVVEHLVEAVDGGGAGIRLLEDLKPLIPGFGEEYIRESGG